MTAQTFTIELPNFREARPVAEIVQTASQYESEIYFVSGNKKINAKATMKKSKFRLMARMKQKLLRLLLSTCVLLFNFPFLSEYEVQRACRKTSDRCPFLQALFLSNIQKIYGISAISFIEWPYYVCYTLTQRNFVKNIVIKRGGTFSNGLFQ